MRLKGCFFFNLKYEFLGLSTQPKKKERVTKAQKKVGSSAVRKKNQGESEKQDPGPASAMGLCCFFLLFFFLIGAHGGKPGTNFTRA